MTDEDVSKCVQTIIKDFLNLGKTMPIILSDKLNITGSLQGRTTNDFLLFIMEEDGNIRTWEVSVKEVVATDIGKY
jgi:hypothetical protein